MSLALTEKQAREIEAFCNIAKENGAVISLRELIGLAAIDASENELATAFGLHSELRSKFLLEAGYVLERRPLGGADARGAVEEEQRRREQARANLRSAGRFGMMLARGAVVVSVSGGNSFLSAVEDEDIDFFCVTPTNGLWPFMLKALILARVHRLSNRDVPELCFSCMMDSGYAANEFRAKQRAIFARDALTAKVIVGEEAYRRLLEDAAWMRDYFPALYGARLGDSRRGRRGGRAGGEQGSAFLNAFVYMTLGSFLRLKSWALNRRLTKAEDHSSVFATRIGAGHYIYESNRYRDIRGMYGELERGED